MRRRGWSLAVTLWLWPCVAQADVVVIYRKLDGVVAGWVMAKQDSAATTQAVETELRNAAQSELGGTPQDYAQLTVPTAVWETKQGRTAQVKNGAVVFVTDPLEVRRQASVTKLKALGIEVQDLKDALGQ